MLAKVSAEAAVDSNRHCLNGLSREQPLLDFTPQNQTKENHFYPLPKSSLKAIGLSLPQLVVFSLAALRVIGGPFHSAAAGISK